MDTPLGTPIISIPINPPILTPPTTKTGVRKHRAKVPVIEPIIIPPELDKFCAHLKAQGILLQNIESNPYSKDGWRLIMLLPAKLPSRQEDHVPNAMQPKGYFILSWLVEQSTKDYRPLYIVISKK